MFIDDIFRSFKAFLLKQETYENNAELDVFARLISYIQSGTYTNRRNKSFLLKNWMELSNKELSNHLGISVSAVSYAKKSISEDLKRSLGLSILEDIGNNDFQNIQQVIMNEETYFAIPTLFPPSIINEIKQRNAVLPMEMGVQYTSNRIQELLYHLYSGVTDDKNALQFYQALQLLQKMYVPKMIEELQAIDLPLLCELIKILTCESGTAELRHQLIQLLMGTPLNDNYLFKYQENSH